MPYLKNKVLLAVVAYNPAKEILNLLVNLSDYHIVVMDNSTPPCKCLENSCLNSKFHKYVGCDGNIGIAGALNNAAKIAIAKNYDYLVSLDQDSEVTTTIIDNLAELVYASPHRSLIATISPRHRLENVTLLEVKEEYTDSIFGLQSANFINLSIFQRLNGFNESLFIDMVDTEYYIRARLAGYKCLTCNFILMSHPVGQNVKELKIFGKYIRAFNDLTINTSDLLPEA